jgi:hypothetical protein
MRAAALIVVVLIAGAGCDQVDADGPDVDAGIDDDPLLVTAPAEAGSLDDLHERIIKPRCSGTPGLCHNGQFEPNLSTPGLTYAYLVRRPGLEKPDRLRVDPEHPERSLLVDKLLGRNGVATQMPLGAEPLSDGDIEAIEAWIAAGALRAPGMAPAPVLNNPPRRPDIGVFAANGTRLDDGGGAVVGVGDVVTLRHTVADFETADADIPFAAIALFNADGRRVVLEPGGGDPSIGATTYDADGPLGGGDVFDWRRTWTVTDPVPMIDDAGVETTAEPEDVTLTPIAIYYDQLGEDGIATYAFGARTIQVEP